MYSPTSDDSITYDDLIAMDHIQPFWIFLVPLPLFIYRSFSSSRPYNPELIKSKSSHNFSTGN